MGWGGWCCCVGCVGCGCGRCRPVRSWPAASPWGSIERTGRLCGDSAAPACDSQRSRRSRQQQQTWRYRTGQRVRWAAAARAATGWGGAEEGGRSWTGRRGPRRWTATTAAAKEERRAGRRRRATWAGGGERTGGREGGERGEGQAEEVGKNAVLACAAALLVGCWECTAEVNDGTRTGRVAAVLTCSQTWGSQEGRTPADRVGQEEGRG